jgi:hypothetical protein
MTPDLIDFIEKNNLNFFFFFLFWQKWQTKISSD